MINQVLAMVDRIATKPLIKKEYFICLESNSGSLAHIHVTIPTVIPACSENKQLRVTV
jgi:hypothetical protein